MKVLRPACGTASPALGFSAADPTEVVAFNQAEFTMHHPPPAPFGVPSVPKTHAAISDTPLLVDSSPVPILSPYDPDVVLALANILLLLKASPSASRLEWSVKLSWTPLLRSIG